MTKLLQKLLTFFQQKTLAYFRYLKRLKFNESSTNDVVCLEQPAPGILSPSNYIFPESGRLEREEFENMISYYTKPIEEIELELKDAFRVFDRDGDGFIDREGIALMIDFYSD